MREKKVYKKAYRTRNRHARRRRRSPMPWVFLLLLLVMAAASFWLHGRKNKAEAAPASTEAASSSLELSESELYYQQVQQTAALNATNTAPSVKDPAQWQANAQALMARLQAEENLTKKGFTIQQKEGFPYLLAVNRAASTVTVYAANEAGQYVVPYMAMVCSGGTDTPLGYFSTPVNYHWRLLSGPCYGQYATRIWSSYLFHSVPYYTQHKDDLEYDEYNKLGSLASLGCIRLEVVDVKWIYDNCPIGTPVVIYDDAADPGPMGKPGTIYIDPEDETLRGWDPTDPDPLNPWDDKYLTGTTIRSEAAWEEYNAAQADGRWTGSLNPADLRGESHDSKIEGTRG